MFAKILYTLIGVGFGLSLIIYTEPIKRFTGSVEFAEKWLGSGGTYNFLKLLGIFLIVFTILWATGTIHRIIPDVLLPTQQELNQMG